MDDGEYISKEDMETINKAKTAVQDAVAIAEKATAQAKIVDLECNSVILRTYIKYGLKMTDQIGNLDGRIIRMDPPEPVVEPQEEQRVS